MQAKALCLSTEQYVRRLTGPSASLCGLVALVQFVSDRVVNAKHASGGNEFDRRRQTNQSQPCLVFSIAGCDPAERSDDLTVVTFMGCKISQLDLHVEPVAVRSPLCSIA